MPESIRKTCFSCGQASPVEVRFCSGCGASLTDPAHHVSNEAERRQLTVMFCDLMQSTHLATQLDPEDLRSVLATYQQSCASAVERFGGSIAQYLGDGLLVYFGYPIAREDAPQRAIRAGLAIMEALDALNARLHREMSIELAVRVGIHTGLVVIGEMGSGDRHERLALGETPNVAARVQGVAGSGTVLVTRATHSLVEGCFEFGEARALQLKGLARRVEVVPVLREIHSPTRFATAARITALVGREEVTERLIGIWEDAKRSPGRACLLTGDAGIGKSRVAEALKGHVTLESHLYLECRGSPFFQDSALHPLIDLIERVSDMKEADTHEERLGKLEGLLRPFPLPFGETVMLLATLLSIEVPAERHEPLALTPQARRRRTMETVIQLLAARARRSPLLLVVEDLHWIDASTLEFLNGLLEGLDMAVMLLLTSRSGFEPAWTNPSAVDVIRLEPLSPTESKAVVEEITGGKRLPPELCSQLVERSDGVPLFVEEMTKAVLDSGHLIETETGYELRSSETDLDIPATLKDPLMARLDQQAEAKSVAQQAAVVGRTFSYELLRELSPLDEAPLQRGLERLLHAGLLRSRGEGAEVVFTFKHALIQQAAYESLLKRTRQRLHLEIAHALEARASAGAGPRPEILAHHYAAAGRRDKAAEYWLRAREEALKRSAKVEVETHFRRGLKKPSRLMQHRPAGASHTTWS